MNLVFKNVTIFNRIKNWIKDRVCRRRWISIPVTGSFAVITPCENCNKPAFWWVDSENNKLICSDCGYEKEKGEEIYTIPECEHCVEWDNVLASCGYKPYDGCGYKRKTESYGSNIPEKC